MDINEYIASGILETVALGLASEQEQKEVRCLGAIYPEIQEEFERVQAKVEAHFSTQASEVNPAIKASLLDKIRQTEQVKPEGEQVVETGIKPTAKIVTLKREANPWKFVAAASIVLTLGLFGILIQSNSQMKTVKVNLAAKEKDMTKMGQMMDVMTLEQQHLREVQTVLADEKTKTVMLMGTPMEPSAKVKIMWSDGMKKAVIHADKIAPPPVNMQYQLWAIVDGKPMSVGVFTYDEVEQMSDPFEVGPTNISAFAITLEKMGGNPTPTLEKMVVMGSTNG